MLPTFDFVLHFIDLSIYVSHLFHICIKKASDVKHFSCCHLCRSTGSGVCQWCLCSSSIALNQTLYIPLSPSGIRDLSISYTKHRFLLLLFLFLISDIFKAWWMKSQSALICNILGTHYNWKIIFLRSCWASFHLSETQYR